MNFRLLCAFLTLPLLALQGCLFSSGGGGKGNPAQVFHGYYIFTNPSAAAAFSLDSTVGLAWTTSDSAGTGVVRLSLYKGEAFLANLSASLSNTGTYSWSLPGSRSLGNYRMGSGSSYRLRLVNVTDSTKWDFSPYFSIYSKYAGGLGLTGPASGTQAKLDSILAITWVASGDVGPVLGLQLFKDTVFERTITSAVSNNGTYSWLRVATTLGSGSDYHIRVFSLGDPAISNMGPAFRIASNWSGSYAFKYPKSGDTLITGGYAKATWTVTGSPGVTAALSLWRDSIKVATVGYTSTATADSLNWTIPAGLTTGNRYRLCLTSASDAGIAAFSPYFAVKGADPDAYEKDDSLELSKAIETDGKMQQHTLTLQDSDWMRFSTKAGKRYLVSLRASVSMYVNVADSVGRLEKEQSGSNVLLTFIPAYAGVHHVHVFPYSTSASALGPYQIAVSEYDSTESPYKASFTAPDAKTTWAAGSSYNITWSPDSLYFGSAVTLSLYSDTALSASLTSYVSNNGTYAWSIPAGTYTSEKYRIRITAYNNAQVYAYSPYFAISGVTPDDYEPDNTRPNAKLLASDGKPQAHGLTVGDIDWIRIDASKGKRYVASFNTKLSMYVYVLDSGGVQLYYQSGTHIALPIAPTYNGAYYLRVNENIGNGDYAVTLTAYDSSANGFPAHFTVPDTAATWASGSSYTVNWTPDSALYGTTVSLSLFLDSVQVVSLSTSAPNTGTYSWSVPAGLATSSRYHLRLAAATSGSGPLALGFGPYFSISGVAPDAFEPDNARGAAKAITVDGVAQARNLTAGDTDWVSFSGVVGKSYLAAVNSSSASVYLSITDSVGAVQANQSGASFSMVYAPTKAGKFFLRAVSLGSYGPYTLALTAYDASQGGVPVKFTAPDTNTTWSAGSAYTATWSPDSAVFGSYVTLGLYLDNLFLASLASSTQNTGSIQVTLPQGLATGKNYRIRMTSGTNALVYGSSRYFSIGGIAADALEPNDSAGAAKAVVPNSARQNLSLSYRDKDWMRFAAKAQMLYIIQAVSATTLATTLRLWPESGTGALLTNTKTSSDTLNSLAWVASADGNYAVSLEAVSSAAYGAYAFEIKEVDPASYKLPVSVPASGAAFKAGEAISIQWSDPAAVKGYVDLFLYDASGVVQTIAANQANNGSYAWTAPAGLPARSDYYVKIISRLNSGINGVSGAFSLAP